MADVSTMINGAANNIATLKGVAQANSAFNAEQARLQREWSEQQSAKAMQFNANEAAKNRNWQEMMSNTAHQREVKDLMAAGLNPVLSAMNGNGASVGSGATASGVVGSGSSATADTSLSGALVNLFGSMLSAQTQLQNASVSAINNLAVADKYTSMEKIVAEIGAAASKYSSDNARHATEYSADSANDASRYSADRSKIGAIFTLLSEVLGQNNGSNNKSSASDVVSGLVKQNPKYTQVYGEDAKQPLSARVMDNLSDGVLSWIKSLGK